MKSSTSNKLTIYAGTAVLLAVFAIAAGVLAGAQFAVPIVILAALVLGSCSTACWHGGRILEQDV